jgi:hypothetical protein
LNIDVHFVPITAGLNATRRVWLIAGRMKRTTDALRSCRNDQREEMWELPPGARTKVENLPGNLSRWGVDRQWGREKQDKSDWQRRTGDSYLRNRRLSGPKKAGSSAQNKAFAGTYLF